MKKAIIAIVALLFLCVLCCVVMFFAARSLPALMDMLPKEVQDIVQTGMEQTGTQDQDTNNNSQEDSNVNDGTYRYDDGETSWEINTQDKTWPSDMPAGVPQFEYGTIDSVNKISSNEGTTWSVQYNNVTGNSYAGYKSAVEAAGFADLFTFETDTGWSVGGSKGDVTLFSVYDQTEGLMTLVVTQLVEEK
jgi:hypothetical protein